MSKIMKIDEMIKATKLCTKALMALSYKNYLKKENINTNINIKHNPSGEVNIYKRN